ncbi:hypothetical protein [Roseateles sp. LYH14W]|uniref:Uncharacterized protein n=1 Tax=Pelomonas parva TaxID=3299032 RepID=A0ABW7F553_9BURK
MRFTHLLLRAAAHGLIGITLGLATWLIADSLPLAFQAPAGTASCPSPSFLTPGEAT